MFLNVLKRNLQVFLSPVLILFFMSKLKKPVTLSLSIAVLCVLSLASFSTAHYSYFILAFPYLAVVGAYSLNRLSERLNGSVGYVIVLSLLLISYMPAIEQYGMHEKQVFSSAEEMSSYVMQNSVAHQTIFGDSETASLIALLSNRSIALDCVDSNMMRFRSGAADIHSTLGQLEASDDFKFFIGREKAGIYSMNEVRRYIAEDCREVLRSQDEYGRVFYVFDCSV